MSQLSQIMEPIMALMDAGGIAPTPANYEFWYRYVTKADPQLVEAVDAVRRTAGRVNTRAMENIRHELFGRTDTSDITRLIDQTQAQLQRMAVYVEQSEGDARTYNEALRDSHMTLTEETGPETQRALLAEMVNATAAMIEKTERLEAQLAMSGQEIATLRRDLEMARSESRTDPLTGLPNRKAFNAYLDAQATRAAADRRSLCLVFCDIDHFKRFNDTWGHRLGDEVLRLVGQSIEQLSHGQGFPARFGGEEFVIVLPNKSLPEATRIAEQFRDFVGSRTVRAKQSNREVGRITLSLGVAQLHPNETVDQLIERADAALYCAKQKGRNRVCTEADLIDFRKTGTGA